MNIKSICNELIKVLQEGPILPGGLRETFATCGKENCKCKRVNDPQLHGPYNILSFSLKEKSSTMSLAAEEVATAEEMVQRFQEVKSLLNKLGIAYAAKGRGHKILELEVPELGKNSHIRRNDTEKNRSKKKSQKIEEKRIKIKNLSRDLKNYKNKYNKIKAEKQSLETELNLLRKQFCDQEKTIDQLELNIKKKVLMKL
jgi:chromosome segregation ATPase